MAKQTENNVGIYLRLSKEDMLKMQKDKKKVAKASNNMKKKM